MPRDLLDAPLTGLNRLGLGRVLKEGLTDPKGLVRRQPVTLAALATVGGVAGSIAGFGWGLDAAAPHLFQVLFYTEVGAFGGGLLGAIGGAAADVVLGACIPPIQTVLLRTGIDGDLWKGAPPEVIVPQGRWDEQSASAYERLDRSLCYFPNWRYGVRNTRFAPPDPNLGADQGVAIDDVRVVAEPVPASNAPVEPAAP